MESAQDVVLPMLDLQHVKTWFVSEYHILTHISVKTHKLRLCTETALSVL